MFSFRRLVLPVLMLGILLVPAGKSFAGGALYTGMELQEKCAALDRLNANNGQGRDDDSKFGECLGYVSGVLDTKRAELVFPLITTGQVVQIVQKYMRDHPERLHLPADKIIVLAIRRAFPQ